MGSPAAVMGDRINGTCVGHQVPAPSGTAPAPPLAFSAPVTINVAATVLVGGRAAVVAGSSGYNTPPHVGLHASDPHATPINQIGRVVRGSSTVLVEGKPMAMTGAPCTIDFGITGNLVGSAGNVLVGG